MVRPVTTSNIDRHKCCQAAVAARDKAAAGANLVKAAAGANLVKAAAGANLREAAAGANCRTNIFGMRHVSTHPRRFSCLCVDMVASGTLAQSLQRCKRLFMDGLSGQEQCCTQMCGRASATCAF